MFNYTDSSPTLTPAQIVIIRHAEKPESGNELSESGQQRAHLLPIYFNTNEILTDFGKPAAIFAAAPRKIGDSIRCIQTVIPLATNLNLEINQNFTKKNIHDLEEYVMSNPFYFDRTVIICWDHLGIPTMARLFGAMGSPVVWDKNVYDRTWIIRFGRNEATRFINFPQKIFPCDTQV